MVAERTSELIKLRERWVGVAEMAVALGLDRTTIWKREKFPEQAPAGFWDDYAAELHTRLAGISDEVREAAAALVGGS